MFYVFWANIYLTLIIDIIKVIIRACHTVAVVRGSTCVSVTCNRIIIWSKVTSVTYVCYGRFWVLYVLILLARCVCVCVFLSYLLISNRSITTYHTSYEKININGISYERVHYMYWHFWTFLASEISLLIFQLVAKNF